MFTGSVNLVRVLTTCCSYYTRIKMHHCRIKERRSELPGVFVTVERLLSYIPSRCPDMELIIIGYVQC